MAHRMRNLPTITVLAVRSKHRNIQPCTQCRLCGGSSPETARRSWGCPLQSHEWRPARQRLHTWRSTYVGPRASHVQSQLWDCAVLEEWWAAIAMPSLWVAHMGLAGLHDMGTEFIRQVLSESQKVWLAHARAHDGLIKARSGPRAQWRGGCENFNYASRRNGRVSPGRPPN